MTKNRGRADEACVWRLNSDTEPQQSASSQSHRGSFVMTRQELDELLGVDRDSAPCPVNSAHRLRLWIRTLDYSTKIECSHGYREAMLAEALSRRSGQTITAEDLLNITEPVK
jgi:hypothetical protein